MSTFDHLANAYGEISDLGNAASLLSWDQQTYMPPKGFESRGLQLATLSGIIHERMTSPALGEAIAAARGETLDPTRSAFIRELEYSRERSTCLPASLVKALALQESKSFEAWQNAKASRDFKLFAPQLEELVKLVREKAACFGGGETPWDALAQDYERGVSASTVRTFFEPLRLATVELLGKIRDSKQINASFLDRKWPVERQKEFGLRVLRDLGFDMAGGRQDLAPHPFCTGIGKGDIRITTRFKEEALLDGLGSTIHEMGHALYDEGYMEKFARTPLAEAPSLGIHESQSRFWEVRIGQSLPFWEHYLPIMAQYFPGQLDGVTPEMMYRAVNRIEPDFIRVEADEITYNLHIIIRFELEVAILDGSLAVKDIPGAWNESYRKTLGLTPPNDTLGCLQDVHWAYGSFGYFPSYTFGNIYAAMLVEKMESDLPKFWDGVRDGRTAPILNWLRTNIHHKGRTMDAMPLMRHVTAAEPSPDALIRYLRAKYSQLYGFSQ